MQLLLDLLHSHEADGKKHLSMLSTPTASRSRFQSICDTSSHNTALPRRQNRPPHSPALTQFGGSRASFVARRYNHIGDASIRIDSVVCLAPRMDRRRAPRESLQCGVLCCPMNRARASVVTQLPLPDTPDPQTLTANPEPRLWGQAGVQGGTSRLLLKTVRPLCVRGDLCTCEVFVLFFVFTAASSPCSKDAEAWSRSDGGTKQWSHVRMGP